MNLVLRNEIPTPHGGFPLLHRLQAHSGYHIQSAEPQRVVVHGIHHASGNPSISRMF